MRRLAAASAAVFAVAAVFIGMLLNRNAKIREQLLSSLINESRALSALSNNAFKEGGSTFTKGVTYLTNEDYELSGGEKKFGIKEIEAYKVLIE